MDTPSRHDDPSRPDDSNNSATPTGTGGDHPPWAERVAAYVDELADVTETIEVILDDTRVRTVGLEPGRVDGSTKQLAAAISRLEAMVERREELLHAEDAPQEGLSLSEKLLRSRQIEHARLARRCGELAHAIDEAHHRAVGLFVCQYHLAQFQQDLLQRLSGAAGPATYDRSGQTSKRPPASRNGGLFNDAA